MALFKFYKLTFLHGLMNAFLLYCFSDTSLPALYDEVLSEYIEEHLTQSDCVGSPLVFI